MGASVVAAKPEEKKSKATAAAALDHEPPQLQWSTGAAAGVPRFAGTHPVQTQLAVNAPGDAYEQEADRIAEITTQSAAQPVATPPISSLRVGTSPSPQYIDEKAPLAGAASDPGLAVRVQSPGAGRPLPRDLRTQMETSLGADFSQVRIHDNAVDRSDADRLNARAFTHGSDIWIGSSGSATDRKLLAHELTHVVQQSGGQPGLVQRQPETDGDRSESASGQAPLEMAVESEERTLPLHTEIIPEPPPIVPAMGDYAAGAENASATTPLVTEASPSQALTIDAGLETGSRGVTATADRALSTEHGASLPVGTVLADTRLTEPVAPIDELSSSQVAMPLRLEPPPVTPPNAPPPPTTIQRDDGDDSLLGRIRSRISGIVDDLRGGWNRLTASARSAFESVRDFVGGLVSSLASLVSSALSAIQGAWTAISRQITDLTNTFLGSIKSAFNAVSGITAVIKQAVLRLDAAGLRAAWGRLTGLVGGIVQGLQARFQALNERIAGLWQGLRSRFDGMMQGLAAQARMLFTRLGAAVKGIRDRLTSAWESLRSRASEMSGLVGGILNRLLSWATDVWNGIQSRWNALADDIGSVFASIRERLAAAWNNLKDRASALFSRIVSLWTRLKQSVAAQVARVITAARSFWNRLSGFSIGSLLEKVERYSKFVRVISQAAQDPDGIMKPMVDGITKKLQAAMPAKAIEVGTQRLNEAQGRSAPPAPQPGVVIQRQPISPATPAVAPTTSPPATASPARTTDWGEVWAGFVAAIKYKWALVDLWQLVKDMLRSIIWPWPSVWKELLGLWDDLKYFVGSFFVPRSPLADFWGFLHDLWSDLMHLLELPLAIGRRLTNIGLLLMGWVTLALVILGFIGGEVVGGIIGAIAGFFAGGVGAIPGAAAGAGVGGPAGAGIGFGVAMGIGEVFVLAYLGFQGATIEKTLLTLETALQTDEEKDRDYGVLADSLIGVGVTLVLLAIGYLASRLAGTIVGAIEGKVPSVSAFLRGLRSVRAGSGVEPDTNVPGRVTEQVPGLRESIDPTVSPDSAFSFEDTWDTEGDETVVTTKVKHTNGSTGEMQRGINNDTGEIVYHYAFFDGDLPRWIQTDPPMVPDKGGTPLETYMTLRQLKMLSEKTGLPTVIAGPRVVRLSTIVNERTIAELAEFTTDGTPLDQAILRTHSVQYAQNSIIQSGGKIASAHVEGGRMTDASNAISENPSLIAEHGLTPSTKVLYGFDIILNVVPADAPVPGPVPNVPPPAPPPVPTPQRDRDGGTD